MHISELHLTLAITAEGSPAVLYIGWSREEAEAKRLAAGLDIREVGVSSHPAILMPRFPIEEAALIEDRAQEGERARNRAAALRAKRIAELEAQGEQLVAELATLRQPETGTIVPEPATPPAPEPEAEAKRARGRARRGE